MTNLQYYLLMSQLAFMTHYLTKRAESRFFELAITLVWLLLAAFELVA